MPAVTNVTIGSTATSILLAAAWKTLGSPVWLKNESSEIITLTISGADTYELDPGEPLKIIPGQIITGTAVGGAAKLQIIEGITPADESASKGGGSVAAAGSVAAGDGRGKWSVGQNDFTAVYLSLDELTLGAFPAAMGTPVSGDFSMVVVTDSLGVQRAYFPTANAMVLTAQVLKVTGAAFVTGASADKGYDVIAWGPPRGYDASINGDQVDVLNQPQHWLAAATPVDVTDGADDTYEYFIDCATYLHHAIQALLSCTAGTVTLTIWATALDDSTAAADVPADEWEDVTSAFGVASLVATAGSASKLFMIDTPFPAKYIKIKVVAATGGNTGDWKINYREVY